MISTGRFQPSCTSKSLFTTTSISFSCKTHLGLAFFPNPSSTSSLLPTIFKNSSSLSPIQQSQHTQLCFRGVCGQRSRGSRVPALKKQRKGGAELLEMDDSDDELDGDDDLDGGDDEDDDDDMLVPFGQMKKWLENKPRGFGEGKVYDTPIEDKLLDEMEKSRQTQTDNLIKLQNDPKKPNPKQDQLNNNNNKAHEVASDGVRVRVLNLPKKKNIHRDLSSVFKLVPGMISINPVVSGNKKTKDPICKGFAFVHFKSEEDANRFVEMFSSQSVTFGKIQKQIKCEMVNPRPPNSAEEQSTDNYTAPQLTVSGLKPTSTVSGLGGDQNADSDLDDSSMDTSEETVSDEYDDPDDELIEPELQGFMEKLESTSVSGLNVGDRDRMELRTESKSLQDLSPSKQLLTKSKEEMVPHQKLVVKGKVKSSPKKKLNVKEKGVKATKSIIGGSSKRLKVKEKAVLNDVFSKYGLKPALAAKEES